MDASHPASAATAPEGAVDYLPPDRSGQDGVAVITLAARHNRNALSAALRAGLAEALDAAQRAEDCRVVRLRSADRVFCAGADLAEARSEGMERGAREIVALQRQILALDKPVVAEIAGPVRAGGIGLVAACDVAIAAHEATFALTEVKLGLAAAIISVTVHSRMTPRAASLTTLGGAPFDARRAQEYGLITAAVPAEDLDDEVGRVCAELAGGHPQGLRESKRVLNAGLLRRLDAEGERLATLSAELFASEPAQQAFADFFSRS